MMCVLHKLSNERKLLKIFDWFLTQTSDPDEKVSNLNISVKFRTKDLFELERYESCQFSLTLNERNSLQELIRKAESFKWDVSNDQNSKYSIEQVIIV